MRVVGEQGRWSLLSPDSVPTAPHWAERNMWTPHPPGFHRAEPSPPPQPLLASVFPLTASPPRRPQLPTPGPTWLSPRKAVLTTLPQSLCWPLSTQTRGEPGLSRKLPSNPSTNTTSWASSYIPILVRAFYEGCWHCTQQHKGPQSCLVRVDRFNYNENKMLRADSP